MLVSEKTEFQIEKLRRSDEKSKDFEILLTLERLFSYDQRINKAMSSV
jgi:hypothetical protein